ncbi:elongase of fatty acids ELO [Hysterangium stoloniferum]|nr:elongase of fatty acids ELO [Hysterangium stoloniferum]
MASITLVNNYLHHIKDLVLPRLPSSIPTWEAGRSPLSTWPTAVATLMGYVGFVLGLQELMRPYKAFQLNNLAKAHNVFLSAGSFVLLALFAKEIAPILFREGFFYAICNADALTTNMETYYMIAYYSKFYELLDTVFLALKKKPLAFIHVFHHAATPLLGLVALNSRIIMGWFPFGLNLAVHVVMYYYYYVSAGGYKIWWKKYITTIQIGQFVLDAMLGYFVAYAYFASNYFPTLPAPTECSKSGTGSGLLSGSMLATIYLFLFSSFYKETYKPSPSSNIKKSLNGVSKP